MSEPADQVIAKLVREFDEVHPQLKALELKLKALIKELLPPNLVYAVDSRTKEHDSFKKKLSKLGANYTSLSEVTDKVGIRIITFFAEDVDHIAGLIESEFTVNRVHTIDKRAALKSDQFGYLSLHYIVSLSDARKSLTEYKKFGAQEFEIQVRSILQHAWAEIEHDLGYKSKLSIPPEVRRRFSRLAGLLEVADSEFTALRSQLAAYEKETVGLATTVDVTVDLISLAQFIGSQSVGEIDRQIVELIGASLAAPSQSLLRRLFSRLSFLEVRTIQALE